MRPIPFETPFAPRKAFLQVRDQTVRHLSAIGAARGDAFFSEPELMRMAGVSRTTLRKALDLLVAEGWLERRAGVGTFVGARAKFSAAPKAAPVRGGMRVAIVLHNLANAQPDWYSLGVLGALDGLAAQEDAGIEVLGSPQSAAETQRILRRLGQSRPDAVVLMPSCSHHAMLAGAVTAMGVPCFFLGAHFINSGLPTVCEDGPQGVRLAVGHLARKRGRKRVGMLLATLDAGWVMERRRAFVEACAEFNTARDEGLLLWTPFLHQPQTAREQRESETLLDEYLRRYRPDALVLGCSGQHGKIFKGVLAKNKLKIPRDIEVVAFDQNYAEQEFCFGRRLPTVELPIAEQCRAVLRMVRQHHDGAAVDSLPQLTRFPCRLVLP